MTSYKQLLKRISRAEEIVNQTPEVDIRVWVRAVLSDPIAFESTVRLNDALQDAGLLGKGGAEIKKFLASRPSLRADADYMVAVTDTALE